MTWPAFWGVLKDQEMKPLNPEEAHSKLRRVLRVRRDFTDEIAKVRISSEDKAAVLGAERADVPESELSDDEKAKLERLVEAKRAEAFREKLAEAFQALAEDGIEGTPVYVSGGKAYRFAGDGKVETFEHAAAKPYAWPVAHDVRPARQALGAGGCVECHAEGAPLFYGSVAALGRAPDDAPATTVMHELLKLDTDLLTAWNQSFRGRDAFKWVAFVSVGTVALLLLLFLLIGVNGLLKLARGRRFR
jgi:hypothetical protein